MARKRQMNPVQIAERDKAKWMNHYMFYLSSLTYQLFEWKNLPETIDMRYLETELHTKGYVGFYNDPEIGYIVSSGAYSGRVNHYNQYTEFQCVSPTYNKKFQIYDYLNRDDENTGVIIRNNDLSYPTIPSISLFAQELAETQRIISVNRNAQKTPVLITSNDNTILTMKNIYNQYEGNAPVIITHESINPDTIKVFKTDAPYVVDKLREDRNKIWNEFMTFIGVKNANLEKRERMVTDEVESNNEQIQASGNMFLKARQEACAMINELYGLDVEVCFRSETIERIENEIEGGEKDGGLYNATT